MLIFFRKSDGAVVSNSGTNSLMPLGRDDEEEEFALNVEPRGIARALVDYIRVDDRTPLAGQIVTSLHHVNPSTKAVVLDGPIPTPVVDPQIAADKSIVTAFMGDPSGTATDVQRDDVAKAILRYLRRMGQDA